jgi:hypothetical protein
VTEGLGHFAIKSAPDVLRRHFNREEVNTMKYEKPCLIEVSTAIDAVQDTLAKMAGPVEVTDLMTVSAYASDE